MIDRDVVFAKVNNIQNALARVHEMTAKDPSKLLTDLNVQDIVVLNLQRAVQSLIDIAAHVVASQRLGIPQTQKDLFKLLQKSHLISEELSLAMQKMVGFRNIAVHDYGALDPHILQSIIENHLGEIEAFYTCIINHSK